MKSRRSRIGLLPLAVLFTIVIIHHAAASEIFSFAEVIVEKTDFADTAGSTISLFAFRGTEYCSQYSFFSDSADTIKKYSQYERLYRKKSPAMAFVYGFFPGFIIHGMGHYYIGEAKTGNLLLAGELTSIVAVYISTMMGLGKRLDGDSSGEPTAEALTFLGFMTFAGTWGYDFTAAPYKASRLNRRHGYSIHLEPRINGDMASVNLWLSFK